MCADTRVSPGLSYLVYMQEGVARADGHGFDNGASLDRLVMLRVDQIQHINQWRALAALRLAIGRRGVVVIVVVPFFILQEIILVVFVFLVDYPCGPVTPPPAPPSSFLLGCALLVFLLLAGILVEEEDGPVLVAGMGLIGQHQLRQHVLVPSNGNRILVFHNRAPIDIEGGDKNILDMVLG